MNAKEIYDLVNNAAQTKIWLSKNYPKEYIPQWFLDDWQKYASEVKQMLANNNNKQMISG